MQPFLFGKQPSTTATSSRIVLQTYAEAVASGTLILSASGVRCKCGFRHGWGPRSNEWNAHRARDQHQSWQRSQLGKRTLETQPIDSDKVECERAAAIAEANEAKRRRMEEQEEALRHAAARAAELAAADEPGAGSTSSQSLAPLFAANSAFLRHDVALVDVTR